MIINHNVQNYGSSIPGIPVYGIQVNNDLIYRSLFTCIPVYMLPVYLLPVMVMCDMIQPCFCI